MRRHERVGTTEEQEEHAEGEPVLSLLRPDLLKLERARHP